MACTVFKVSRILKLKLINFRSVKLKQPQCTNIFTTFKTVNVLLISYLSFKPSNFRIKEVHLVLLVSKKKQVQFVPKSMQGLK